MNRNEDQSPITFVDMPERLPNGTSPKTEHFYQLARRRMYRAQLEAIEIAARECWPDDYQKAKAEFQRKLLELFSMQCNSYRR